jgi:hypothetical protein
MYRFMFASPVATSRVLTSTTTPTAYATFPAPAIATPLWRERGHCHWTWLWNGRGLCPCELCHAGDANRRERRADRQRMRRELRARSWPRV